MADVFDLYVKDNRTIQFKFTEPIMLEDSRVTDWVFHIPRMLNNIDVSGWAWWLVYINARGQKYSELLELSEDPESPLEKCIATYSVDYGMSIKAGIVRFSLEAINTDTGGEILNEWHTQTYQTKVQDTLQGNQVEFAETESDIISALIIEVQNKVAQLVGGATPLPVNLKSLMVDHDKVYLYTGSEPNESTGYWYYYNGTQFVSGGQYGAGVIDTVPTQGSTNAVSSGGVYEALDTLQAQIPQIDPTLSQNGQAADAKETGDRITDLKEDLKSQILPVIDRKLNLKWIDGKFINANNGNVSTSSSFACTEDYYPVFKGQVLNVYAYAKGSGECAVAFYDTSKTFIGYETSGNVLSKFTVANDGYARFTTRKAVISTTDAFVICSYDPTWLGTVYDIEQGISDVKSNLDAVSDVPKNLYKTNGAVLSTGINSSNVLNSNSSCRTVYVPCLPNTKYAVKKIAGTRFTVASSASEPVENGTVSNAVSDDTASEIIYTTDATASYLCAWVWYSSDSTNMWDMLDSVDIRLYATPTAIDRVARASISARDKTINYVNYKKRTANDDKLFVMEDVSLSSSDWGSDKITLSNSGDSLVMACNSTGTHNAWYTFDSAVDMSRCWLGVDLDIAEGVSGELTDFNNIDEIQITLSDQENYSYASTDVAIFSLIINASHILHKGNYKTSINFSARRSGNTTVVDMTTIKHIGIVIRPVSPYDGTPTITLNRLFTYACPKKREIIVGFDGQYSNQKTCCEYMNGKGLVGTIFTDIYSVGSTGRLTLAELIEVQNEENLIASYGRGMRGGVAVNGWYNLTLAEKKETCETISAWMYKNGFGDGASCFSVNAGGYGDGEDELFTDGIVSMLTGRIVVSSTPQPCGFYGPYEQGHSVGPAGTNATRKAVVDSVIEKGGFAIFIFHSCTGQSDDITYDTFTDFIDYLAVKADAGLIDVIPANKLSTYTVKNSPVVT